MKKTGTKLKEKFASIARGGLLKEFLPQNTRKYPQKEG